MLVCFENVIDQTHSEKCAEKIRTGTWGTSHFPACPLAVTSGTEDMLCLLSEKLAFVDEQHIPHLFPLTLS